MSRRRRGLAAPPHIERRQRAGGKIVDVPVDALGRQRLRVPVSDVSFRMDGDEDNPNAPIGFRGHAAVFNSPTWIGGRTWGFMEQIAPGAFTKTISDGADVRLLINHDPNLLLARTLAGNLSHEEDDIGLAVDADMVPTSYARDLALLLEPLDGEDRATIDQMSFAFEIIQEEWRYVEPDEDDDNPRGYDLYTVTEARLWDDSIVTYPAYDDTDAALRAAGFDTLTAHLSDGEVEHLLRSIADGAELPALDLEPANATRSRNTAEPATATRSDMPAADSTGDHTITENSELRRRMLALRTKELAS